MRYDGSTNRDGSFAVSGLEGDVTSSYLSDVNDNNNAVIRWENTNLNACLESSPSLLPSSSGQHHYNGKRRTVKLHLDQ